MKKYQINSSSEQKKFENKIHVKNKRKSELTKCGKLTKCGIKYRVRAHSSEFPW